MQIDIFTVAAQAVNFLILLALLYYFLYRPIMSVMTRREQEVRERLEDAERAREDAQQEADRLAAERQQLESERQQQLEDAEEEASQQKAKLLEEARAQVDSRRQRWFEELEREHESSLNRLQDQVVEQVVGALGRALDDLANERLEGRVIEQFLERLQQLDDSEREELGRGARRGEARVRTAFEPSSERRERLEEGVRQLLGDEVTVDFEHEPELKAGVELAVADHVVSWSIRDYLQHLDEALSLELAERRAQRSDGSEEPSETESAPEESADETAPAGAET